MGLRTRIILLTGLMLVIATLLFGIITFNVQKQALLNGIDARLEATARLAKEILPADYHDNISGAASLSETEYLRIVDRWNRLCTEMGLEYIWSLLLIDGKTVFTSASSTSKDVGKGDHAKFFETHSNPELYAAAFATLKPQYQINDDKWGRIKVVLLPFRDLQGRPFLFGASMKTTAVDALMMKTIRQTVEISAGILFVGILLSVLFSASQVRPLEKVTDLARSISQGNWGQVVEPTGASEIQSLAQSVNEMSRSIKEQISERQQAEAALSESAERYRLIFNNSPLGIMHFDANGVIVDMNETFAKIMGGTPDKIRGFKMLEQLRDQAMIQAVKDALDGRTGYYEDDYVSVTAGKTTPLRTFYRKITAADGRFLGAVGLFEDISERREAEQEKEKLQAQLLQAQKIESVGRLAGGVAHDFNNMLGVILGHVEIAMDNVDSGQPLLANLREIQKAANRSAALTGQMLAFARKQTIAPLVLNLNDTVAGMLKMIERLIGEDVHLVWQPGADLWSLKMDPSQIDQILANLCVNARDAIAGVGKVTIETTNVTFDDDYCASHAECVPGDYILLAVSDDGCGMDRQTQESIFDPFFTTKGTGQGTGLGLATVYGIVKQNCGFINVYSEPNQGSTFRIYLPRHEGHASPIKKERSGESLRRGQETILLVEDEPSLLELNTLLLKGQGYRVLAAGTPLEAIRLAAEHDGEIHLLMTDVVMPEMNGRDLANNLTALYPGLKCLFTSGYTANVIAHHGVLDEGVHFIQKPFSRQDLADKIRAALEGSSG